MPSLTASDKAALHRALEAGLQPRNTGRSRGQIVTTPGLPGQKASFRTLIDKTGALTQAGSYFYAQRQQQAPNRQYDPTQRPVRASRGRSEYITLRDGTHVTVRTLNHMTDKWRLSKFGEEFFASQTDRWIARIPVKTYLKRPNDSYY